MNKHSAARGIRPSGKHQECEQFQHVIKAALFPKLLSKFKKDNLTNQALVQSFEQHTAVLAKFCANYFMDHDDLSIRFIADLHRMLYPAGVLIRSVRYGVPVDTLPGEWRKQVLHPYVVTFSPIEDIEGDLKKIIEDFNQIRQPRREDIFRFYLLFGKVHPFGDANGTLSALVCDVLCFRHGLAPLWILNIRFKDKSFGYRLVSEFEQNQSDQSLTNILRKIDAFHQSYPIQGRPAE